MGESWRTSNDNDDDDEDSESSGAGPSRWNKPSSLEMDCVFLEDDNVDEK